MRLIIPLLLIFTAFLVQGQEKAYSGSFEADSYWTKFEGDWSVSKMDGVWVVEFSDNFEAKKAPDLKVFFSKLSLDDINGDNAADNSNSVLVGELKTYKGKVAIAVPGDIDPKDYQTIIVHCEKYAKLWGGSSLN